MSFFFFFIWQIEVKMTSLAFDTWMREKYQELVKPMHA